MGKEDLVLNVTEFMLDPSKDVQGTFSINPYDMIMNACQQLDEKILIAGLVVVGCFIMKWVILPTIRRTVEKELIEYINYFEEEFVDSFAFMSGLFIVAIMLINLSYPYFAKVTLGVYGALIILGLIAKYRGRPKLRLLE